MSLRWFPSLTAVGMHYMPFILKVVDMVGRYGVKGFRQKFALENAIGSHGEANMHGDQRHSSRVFTPLTG
jgi:hypothetical protein